MLRNRPDLAGTLTRASAIVDLISPDLPAPAPAHLPKALVRLALSPRLHVFCHVAENSACIDKAIFLEHI